jgi:hypothetical protein
MRRFHGEVASRSDDTFVAPYCVFRALKRFAGLKANPSKTRLT